MVDYEDDLILIIGASGKQASALVPILQGKWKRLRLVVNSSSSQEKLAKHWPDAELLTADLVNPHEAERVMKGVTAVYHVGPGFHPHETEIGYFMIDAAVKEAKEGHFKHFVMSSVLNSQLRKMMNHDNKRYVEEYLMESGLNYTILQPTHFMNMFPIQMLMSQDQPVYTAPYNVETEMSFIVLEDLGEASARVLDEREKHYLAQYPLSGTMPLPYTQICKIASKKLGKDVQIKKLSYLDGVDAMLKRMYGDDPPARMRDGVERMLLFYNRRGLVGNPNVLQWLLGREPTSPEDWIAAQVAAIKK